MRRRQTTPRLLLLALLLSVAVPARPRADAGPRIEVRASEVLSLLYLAEAIVGTPSRSDKLMALYRRHRAELPADLPDRIRRALASTSDRIEHFPSRQVAGRRPGRQLLDLMELAAVEARDLKDFARRIGGWLPLSGQAELLEALATLEPFHRRRVWRPGRQAVARSRRALRRLSRRPAMREVLRQAAVFYGTRWPAKQPVTVALVPIPGTARGGHTFAHAAGTLAVLEVLQKDEVSGRFGVLIHEICHSFREAQPLTLQRALVTWFSAHDSTGARLAQGQLNEALATAIGNGHVERLLAGDEVLQGSWYSHEVVDRFAKAIYPEVRRYLAAGRTIDRAFVGRAVALFAKAFPTAALDPRLLFNELALFVDGGLDHRKIYRTIRRRALVTSSHVSSPIDHPKTIANFERLTKMTALFVLAPGAAQRLTSFAMPDKARAAVARALDRGGPFVYATRSGKRLLVFVGSGGKADAAALVGRLVALPRLKLDRVLPL